MSASTSSRIGRLLGYENVISSLLLAVFQYFLVSVSFVACLLPALAFQALVGWQGTHLALWLGAASLITVAPGLQALIVSARRLLEGDGHAGRAFWSAFAHAAGTRWAVAIVTSGTVLLLGYDVALLGATGPVLLGAAAAGALAAVILLASSFAVAGGTELRGLALALVAGRIVLLRPHLALAWLLLAGLAAVATSVPIIGAVAWLFAPALAAVAAVICTRAFGLPFAPQGLGA